MSEEGKALEARLSKLIGVQNELTEMRLAAHRDVILCVHFLMHQRRPDEALMLLCPCATMLEGGELPDLVGMAFANKLNEVNMERAKFECAGSA